VVHGKHKIDAMDAEKDKTCYVEQVEVLGAMSGCMKGGHSKMRCIREKEHIELLFFIPTLFLRDPHT
jgi:hypothetical protein